MALIKAIDHNKMDFLHFSISFKVMIFSFFVWRTRGFNVDTQSSMIYKILSPGGERTYFGYTVSLHADGAVKS